MFKKVLLGFALCLFVATSAFSQIRTPAPSPSATFKQAVGLTDVTIEYSRPGVKGRTVFAADGLVPYGKLWRTGANQATKITFSEDVTLEGQALKAGSYAVLTTPNATSWGVHFYTYESSGFGSYVEKDPDLTVNAAVQNLPFSVHNFFITVGELSDNGGELTFVWDNVLVGVKLGVNTDEAVMANIEDVLAGPSAGDYYAAGTYLFNSGKDLNKALMYVQKATHGESPRFWQVRNEALILAELGRKDEAIKAAKKSLALAKEADNQDYVRMNEKSIADWSM